MSIKSGFKFKVKYVKPFAKGVRFQIGEKIKDSDPVAYINYQVTVFGDYDLSDGDTVTISEINDLEVKQYNGKLYYSLIAKIKEEAKEAPQDSAYDDSSDTSLPFDI